MSQNSPQRRALTRMPTAGTRSWSGYTSCVGRRLDHAVHERRQDSAASLRGRVPDRVTRWVSAWLNPATPVANHEHPSYQSWASYPPARAVPRTMTNFLPIRGRRFGCYSIPIRIGKFIRRQPAPRSRAQPDRSIPIGVHPAAG